MGRHLMFMTKRLNIAYVAVLSKLMYRCNTISIKISKSQLAFFPPRNQQADPKIHMKHKGPRIAKTTFSEKNETQIFKFQN